MAKPWRSRSMASIFNTSWENPKIHIWCKFGDSNSNPLQVIMEKSRNGQNDPEGQGQWPPFSIPAETIPGCMFGANLVILAHIYDELSRGQAKFPRILSQNGQTDLEGQGQWPQYSIPAESIPGCIFGANLVIVDQICDELSRGQAKFPIIFSQNYCEGQGQWPQFSIPAKSIPRCMFGANLVILDQICDELLCRQGKVYRRTDEWTVGQTDRCR